jgi:branched-chain amino acid transport system ATP-binding protein
LPTGDARLLEASGLSTYYGTSQVLFDVALSVSAGDSVAILGRNGAGKTTLLKTLIGELRPARGTITHDGQDITRTPTEVRVRNGIGYVPQEGGVFARLSVQDNLRVGGLNTRDAKARTDEMISLFPRLGQRLSQAAGTLSGGERKMLAISRALIGGPRLLLLDEPTEGVWHELVDELAERLRVLSARMAIVLVEQHLQVALRLARYCYVMDRGRIALEGETESVRANRELTRLLAP